MPQSSRPRRWPASQPAVRLLGIDPDWVVHIHDRLLHEIDGPMLKNGLQHFHGAHILQPARVADRPDPGRLAMRFESFRAA